MIIFFYISILLLLVVFVQDMISRSIWWFLPLLIFIIGVLFRFDSQAIDTIHWNVLFIAGMMLFLGLYLRLRFKEAGGNFLNFFGLGDVLILFAITPFFVFQEFIYVFTFGTCFALITHLVLSIFKRQKTVPYAGYLSLFIASILLLDQFTSFNLLFK